MKQLVLRNIRLYFRDRMSVFFSLMSVLIMLGLYVFFLADMMMDGILETLPDGKDILNLWLLAGLLSIASVTTTFASYGVMIQDRSTGIVKDFYASSISRSKLMFSYICASWIIGMVMSGITLLVGLLYIFLSGGSQLITATIIIQAFLVMLISVGAGSSMMFFLASFLSTEQSFSSASVLLGTLIGFLMGIYIPIGTLPSFAQSIIRFFPMSQGCAAFRQIFVQEPLRAALVNAPVEVLSEVEDTMGITLSYGSITLSFSQHILLLFITLIGFYILSILFQKKKKSA